MSPNKEINDNKKELIPKLCEKFSKHYVADVLGVGVDTVRKYDEMDKKRENGK